MNSRLKIENHKGKEILYCDFSGLIMQKFIDLLHESFDYIQTQQDLLICFNVEKASVFGEALQESKEFAKKIQPFRKKSALTGVVGSKKVLLQSILFVAGSAKHVKAFDTKEQAFNWLVE